MYEACVLSDEEDDVYEHSDNVTGQQKNKLGEEVEMEARPEKPHRSYAKSAIELQRTRLEKLMADPDKPAIVPERPADNRLPRAFEPHEFVRNVMGASAGAGSGEFDIYRGCRRRERIRQHFLFRQEKMKKLDEEFKAKVDASKAAFEEKTSKKRRKRQKMKESRKKKRESNQI